jgi:hypothetical protein
VGKIGMEQTHSFAAYRNSPYSSMKHSSYFAVYDALFSPYRGKPITFVEVGVLGGGSLFMWREFFGPQARIIGIDLNPNARKWEKDGFEIFIGSQSSTEFWQEFRRAVGPVDILLDDGGHTYAQQITTVEAMVDTIRDHGLLVVEDTHTSYMDGFGPRRYSFLEYTKGLIDRINQRSGLLDNTRSENRIWSVQCFESLVALHINRAESTRPCVETFNGKHSDGAADFRNTERGDSWIERLPGGLRSVIRAVPGTRPIRTWLRDSYELRRSRIDRFFR